MVKKYVGGRGSARLRGAERRRGRGRRWKRRERERREGIGNGGEGNDRAPYTFSFYIRQ